MSDSYGNIPISPEKKEKTVKSPQALSPKKTSSQQESHKDYSTLKRIILILLAFILVFASYYGLSSFFVPILIKNKFPDIFQEKTNLSLSIGSAHFNPLDCSVAITSVKVNSPKDVGSQSDLLSISSLFVDLDFISLLRNGIVSDKLEIKGATLTILRNTDKSYNLSQFFSKNSANPSEIMDFAKLPFLYSLNNISISGGTIVFNDLISGKKHKVENLRVSLPTLSNFSFNADTYIQPRFSAILNGSPIELISETTPSSEQNDGSKTTLSCSLKAIDIPLYSHYLPVPFPVEILKGQADGKLQISFISKEDKSRNLILNYQFQAKDVKLSSHDKAIALSSPLLNVEGSLKPLTGDIELKNFILRDPELIVKKSFSASTVDSLFLTDFYDTASGKTPLQLPSLNVALLIVDNGKIIIEDNDKKRVFQSAQLSMRNFVNTIAIERKINPGKGTFRITAEAKDDFSTFSWQGNFENTIPSGNLEINNLALSDLFSLIDPDINGVVDGSVDIRGKLSATRSNDQSFATSLSFKEGTFLASSISLSENKVKWFQGPSIMLTPVSYSKGQFNFGNAIIENSNLHIQQNNLPSLLESFSTEGGHLIGGIDLKGNFSLVSARNKSPLPLSNVHLQIDSLDKINIKGNNFALSASSRSGGTIQAQGKVSLSPLDGTVQLTFVDFPADSLFRRFSSPDLLLSATTTINGKGTYLLPKKQFAGAIEINKGTIEDIASKRVYSFDNAIFGKLSSDSKLDSLDCSKIKLKNFSIKSDDMELKAGNVSVSSLSKGKDSLSIGDISFTTSQLSIYPKIPTLLKSVIENKKVHFSLKKLAIDGNLSLFDNEKEKIALFDEYELIVENLGDTGIKKDNITLKARIGEKGSIRSDGLLSVKPIKARLALQFTEVNTDTLKPLYSAEGKYILHATLNGSVVHHYPERMYSGNINLTDGKLISENTSELLNWKNAELHDFSYTQKPFHFGITTLSLDTPQLQFTQNDTDIFEQINSSINTLFGEEQETTPSSVSISKLDIPQINILNGAVDYLDERLSPVWQTSISAIEGDINNLHVSESTDQFSFHIKGEFGASPFSVEGITVLSSDSVTADYSFNLTNFPLNTLDEQIQDMFEVDTDNATLDLNYQRNDTQPAENNIAQLSFSSLQAKNDAPQTAQMLALLTNSNNILSQDIVVKKNNRTLFSQSANHFQKLLVKSNFSPFLLLPFPYDSLMDYNQLTFNAGEIELNSDNSQTLSNYADLLKAYPRLQLVLEAEVNRPNDSLALKKTLEEEENIRVRQENEKLLRNWQQQQVPDAAPAPTGGAIVVEDIPTKELEAFTPASPRPVVIDDAMLIELGKNRLKQALDFLVNRQNIPEQNIMIREDVILNESAEDEYSKIHLFLSHITTSH